MAGAVLLLNTEKNSGDLDTDPAACEEAVSASQSLTDAPPPLSIQSGLTAIFVKLVPGLVSLPSRTKSRKRVLKNLGGQVVGGVEMGQTHQACPAPGPGMGCKEDSSQFLEKWCIWVAVGWEVGLRRNVLIFKEVSQGSGLSR